MNDEIKEFIEFRADEDGTYFYYIDKNGDEQWSYNLDNLLDYITNLQQENERLKIKCDFLVGKKLAEIDKNAKQIKIKAIEHEDYKSKVEKAINNCKKSIEAINTKLENNKEPFEVVDGKIIYLNDYQVARLKAIRMKCKELLNILQNGDEEK